MGYIFFPLTPALSRWERGNRRASFGHTSNGVCQASVRQTRVSQKLFLLRPGTWVVAGPGHRCRGVAHPFKLPEPPVAHRLTVANGNRSLAAVSVMQHQTRHRDAIVLFAAGRMQYVKPLEGASHLDAVHG